jgi:hypothetical protein
VIGETLNGSSAGPGTYHAWLYIPCFSLMGVGKCWVGGNLSRKRESRM